mgnify:CR=1 FL=1
MQWIVLSAGLTLLLLTAILGRQAGKNVFSSQSQQRMDVLARETIPSAYSQLKADKRLPRRLERAIRYLNRFDDVTPDDYYYDAAIWAYENGMVEGDKFEGDTPCTRASTVVYLWKNAGMPEGSAASAFEDVPADSDFAQAVSWAVETGVTAGTSDTTFSPDMICSRGQIVAFLDRAINNN